MPELPSGSRFYRGPTKPANLLRVRRHVWRIQGRTEILIDGNWEPCPSLDAARQYAAKHGYTGITIQPV